MMKCKYCQAELEDGSTVCPACGKEQEPEQVLEEVAFAVEEIPGEAAPQQSDVEAAQPAAIETGTKLTPGKLALAIAAGVVLLAILVALVLGGRDNSQVPDATDGSDDLTTAATNAAATEPEETVPATIPADGNPDDVTCKGSYTVTDDEIIAAAEDVVATMGDKVLTNADLQVYYWMEVMNFLNDYGEYAIYFGMDYTQPLDTQICEDGLDLDVTWQQYFLELALDNWQCYQSLALEAEANGFEMEQSYAEYLQNLPQQLETSAVNNGMADALELIQKNVGAGADVDDYLRYMELYYQGYTYFNELYTKIQPTEAEIEAYFAENEATYAEEGVANDGSKYVDVRHVLLMPDDENATTDENGYPVYSDEAWEACRQEAEALYEQWKSGDMSEDSFAELAKNNSEDSNASTGGLYSNVTDGYMVEAFNDWCFDAARQVGDHGLVKTQYGYHLMFFSGSRDIWYAKAEEDLISDRANELIPAAMEKHPATIDYSAIKLGLVNLVEE